jgi:hypothetical protein
MKNVSSPIHNQRTTLLSQNITKRDLCSTISTLSNNSFDVFIINTIVDGVLSCLSCSFYQKETLVSMGLQEKLPSVVLRAGSFLSPWPDPPCFHLKRYLIILFPLVIDTHYAYYHDPVFRSNNRSSLLALLGLSFHLLIAMSVNKPQFDWSRYANYLLLLVTLL